MPGAQNLTPGKSNKVVIVLNAIIAAIVDGPFSATFLTLSK